MKIACCEKESCWNVRGSDVERPRSTRRPAKKAPTATAAIAIGMATARRRRRGRFGWESDRRRGRRQSRKRLEVEGEVADGLESLLGVLFETVPQDPLEPRRNVLVRDRKIRRVLPEDRGHGVRSGIAVERALPRKQLVEDRAEREDVAAGVRRPPAHLLGGHVTHGPEHDTRFRACGRGKVRVPGGGALLHVRQLRETEVEDLDPAFVRDENVLGLQVPVHDSLVVRCGEAVRNLDRVVDRPARREPASRQSRPERLALQELRDDVRSALVIADVVHRRDVGVVQDSGRARLLLEPAEPVRVVREGRGQHLDGHVAPEPRILRAIDLSHPARAERRNDFVGAEARTGRERHFSPSTTYISERSRM